MSPWCQGIYRSLHGTRLTFRSRGLDHYHHTRTPSTLLENIHSTILFIHVLMFSTVEIGYFEQKNPTHRDSNPPSLNPNGDRRTVFIYITGARRTWHGKLFSSPCLYALYLDVLVDSRLCFPGFEVIFNMLFSVSLPPAPYFFTHLFFRSFSSSSP